VGRRNLLALAVLTAVVLSACGGDDDGADAPGSQGGGAIASVHTVPQLEPVVRGLVDAYNQASGAGVDLAIGSPSEVVYAVSQGIPAILPGAWLGGVDAQSAVIGRNLAIITVPAGNAPQVTGVIAFAVGSGLDTAMCGADSPFGNFAALVVANGGVQPDLARVSAGCDADAVARVARGELDAALVFRASIPIPDGVEVVTIPDAQNVVIDIRYAPAGDGQEAGSFAQFLLSDPAKQVLAQQGFLP
jgi:Bacterial extracellular solute-binding protein